MPRAALNKYHPTSCSLSQSDNAELLGFWELSSQRGREQCDHFTWALPVPSPRGRQKSGHLVKLLVFSLSKRYIWTQPQCSETYSVFWNYSEAHREYIPETNGNITFLHQAKNFIPGWLLSCEKLITGFCCLH